MGADSRWFVPDNPLWTENVPLTQELRCQIFPVAVTGQKGMQERDRPSLEGQASWSNLLSFMGTSSPSWEAISPPLANSTGIWANIQHLWDRPGGYIQFGALASFRLEHVSWTSGNSISHDSTFMHNKSCHTVSVPCELPCQLPKNQLKGRSNQALHKSELLLWVVCMTQAPCSGIRDGAITQGLAD